MKKCNYFTDSHFIDTAADDSWALCDRVRKAKALKFRSVELSELESGPQNLSEL